MRLRLRDFADLTTVVQGLIALTGAGVLALAAQKIGEVFLGLSAFERIALGVCLFLLLLAVFLSRVKVIRERRAARKSEIEEEKQRHDNEVEGFKTKLRGAEQERNDLLSEVQDLRSMSPQQLHDRQQQRSERIKRWRNTINDFDFNANRFADTDTFLEMKPFLKPAIAQRFELGGLGALIDLRLGPIAWGEGRHRRILLEEVARIESKWGLV